MNVRRAWWVLLLLPSLAGCGGEEVQDAAEDFLSSVGSSAEGVPEMRVLKDAQRELPERARLTGLADDDGDDFDDDGFVAVNLGGEWRCIRLPGDDTAGRVSGGACA